MNVYHLKKGTAEKGQEIDFEIQLPRRLACRNASLSIVMDGGEEVIVPLRWRNLIDGRDVYGIKLPLYKEGLYWYRFYADHYCISQDHEGNAILGDCGSFQLLVYEKKYSSPDFLRGGIMYQIMVDRFFSQDRITSKPYVIHRSDWYGVPFFEADNKGIVPNIDFFGGNLKGITEKLSYLKELNVTCIYLNPIFEANSNHKYDTADYMKIDPLFGSLDDFKQMVRKAGELGIGVILDGVFSHTGCDSLYFNMYGNYPSVGAYQSKKSPYYSWYRFRNHPNEYDSWWGIDILPNTNEHDESFNNFINGKDGVIEYWMKTGIQGWRLDVADELPGEFIERIAKTAKGIKKDALVLGEVWEDASNKISYSERRKYFLGSELDSVTNYVFKDAILDFMLHGSADKFARKIKTIINNYPPHVLHCLMNLIGTHDTARILTVMSGADAFKLSKQERSVYRLNDSLRKKAINRLKQAVVLQYFLPGFPCVYYGDEAGLEGFEDPFNRACYPWGRENTEILSFYKTLGAIRTQSKVLRSGDTEFLYNEGDVCIFKRFDDQECMVIGINRGHHPFECEFDDLSLPFDSFVNAMTGKIVESIHIPPHGMIVLRK